MYSMRCPSGICLIKGTDRYQNTDEPMDQWPMISCCVDNFCYE